jgi:hypothetical protein
MCGKKLSFFDHGFSTNLFLLGLTANGANISFNIWNNQICRKTDFILKIQNLKHAVYPGKKLHLFQPKNRKDK